MIGALNTDLDTAFGHYFRFRKGKDIVFRKFLGSKDGFFQRLPIKEPRLEPEIRLARAVLDKALHDVGGPSIIHAVDSDLFLANRGPDFVMWCDMAQFNVEAMSDIYCSCLRDLILTPNATLFQVLGDLMKHPRVKNLILYP